MNRQPFARNAPGPFYVERDMCLACQAPEAQAPDLMSHVADEVYQCYFQRQPATPEETDRAVMACHISCCGAVRYAGDNPAILQMFRDLGDVGPCDVLETETNERPMTLEEKLEQARRRARDECLSPEDPLTP